MLIQVERARSARPAQIPCEELDFARVLAAVNGASRPFPSGDSRCAPGRAAGHRGKAAEPGASFDWTSYGLSVTATIYDVAD